MKLFEKKETFFICHFVVVVEFIFYFPHKLKGKHLKIKYVNYIFSFLFCKKNSEEKKKCGKYVMKHLYICKFQHIFLLYVLCCCCALICSSSKLLTCYSFVKVQKKKTYLFFIFLDPDQFHFGCIFTQFVMRFLYHFHDITSFMLCVLMLFGKSNVFYYIFLWLQLTAFYCIF